MTRKALAFCERFRLLEDGDAVIIALSGGADSAALLHFLDSIKEDYHLTLLAAHLHHGIRGGEAERDLRFCESLCEKYHIPLTVRRRDIPALARARRIGEEVCGREERYAFFGELAQAHRAKIATAHHADDNAETLLLHLARGCSLRGAGGIPPVRGQIIRPLLACTRAEIEAYCAGNGISYVIDSSNLRDVYSRNKLRHRVMPALRELNPAAETAILRFTQTAAEVSDYLDTQAAQALSAARTAYGYRADALLDLHPAVRSTALYLLITRHHASADAKTLDRLTVILRSGGAVPLSGGITAVCQRGVLCFVAAAPEDSPAVLLNGALSFVYRGKRLTAYINHSNTENKPLLFRTRRAGDAFTFPRRGLTKPLGKALREQNIPASARDSLLCLCEGSVVLWCEALGYSQQGKTYTQTQDLFIELTEEMCYDTAQGH